jgi:hypothetical protein
VETNVITAVSSDGKTLTLATPLKYRHYAGPVTDSSSSPALVKQKQLAAAVGLLSRNVVIKGDVHRLVCHIYTLQS